MADSVNTEKQSGGRRDQVATRRTALKAGVAAGVGVAAWTGPQIGRLGATPAYAAHCTPNQFTTTNFSINKTQVNWGNSCNSGDSGTYGNFGAPETLSNGVIFDADGGCSQNSVQYTLTNVPAGQTCQPTIRAYLQATDNQNPNPNQLLVVGTALSGDGSGTLPELQKSALADPTATNGSWFYEVRLRCADTACFH